MANFKGIVLVTWHHDYGSGTIPGLSPKELRRKTSATVENLFEDPAPAFAKNPAVAFPGLLAVVFSGLLAVVFSGLLGESSSHSKVSVVWNIEEVFLPQLFEKLRGFSSFFRDFGAEALYITLG